MMARMTRALGPTMAGVVGVLAAAASGCLGEPSQVKWAANGEQVTRLEMPLGASGYTFLVAEYTLEGSEEPESHARPFRDRLLLTIHLRGRDGQVLGFGTRTYADGTRRAFSLSATLRPVGTLGANPRVMAGAAWVHPVELEGGPTGYRLRGWVGLRLDVRTGRITAEAP